jgi:DNA gyrase/topoisomerase IV subunit A
LPEPSAGPACQLPSPYGERVLEEAVMDRNVFIIAMDESNLQTMRGLREADRYTFHSLLPQEKVLKAESYDYDELLAMEVVRHGMDVLVATGGGYAKRTPIEEYPVQGRGGKGVVTAKITERRGELVGAVVINQVDELFAITSNGGVIRTPVKPVRRTRDRNTMGVKLMNLPEGVTLVAIAKNADEPDEQD